MTTMIPDTGETECTFTMCPDWLLFSELGGAAKLAYITIRAHGRSNRDHRPSIATIAKLMGTAQNTTRKAIAELEAAQVLKVEYRKDPGNDKLNLPNRYHFYRPADTTKTLVVEVSDMTQEPSGVQLPSQAPMQVPESKPEEQKATDPTIYILKGGKLKGQPIEVLLTQTERTRQWYSNECRADMEAVSAWLNKRAEEARQEAIRKKQEEAEREAKWASEKRATIAKQEKYRAERLRLYYEVQAQNIAPDRAAEMLMESTEEFYLEDPYGPNKRDTVEYIQHWYQHVWDETESKKPEVMAAAAAAAEAEKWAF